MKITEIRSAGLYGATPEGGWSEELRPEDCVHTLVLILTDEGLTGLGSVFTHAGLVKSALSVLEPFYLGENALEPERVSEKLRQNMFWLGRGGSIPFWMAMRSSPWRSRPWPKWPWARCCCCSVLPPASFACGTSMRRRLLAPHSVSFKCQPLARR